MSEDKRKRSCFSCKHRIVCIIFSIVCDNTAKVRMNIDGNDAPGKWNDIFDAIANCCLEYENNLEDKPTSK